MMLNRILRIFFYNILNNLLLLSILKNPIHILIFKSIFLSLKELSIHNSKIGFTCGLVSGLKKPVNSRLPAIYHCDVGYIGCLSQPCRHEITRCIHTRSKPDVMQCAERWSAPRECSPPIGSLPVFRLSRSICACSVPHRRCPRPSASACPLQEYLEVPRSVSRFSSEKICVVHHESLFSVHMGKWCMNVTILDVATVLDVTLKRYEYRILRFYLFYRDQLK